MLGVVQTTEGDLEPDVLKIVENIVAWMPANGKGIMDPLIITKPAGLPNRKVLGLQIELK